MQRVIDTQYTFVLFCRVFATRKSRPALPAPLPLLPSSHSSLFFSEVCSLFSVTAVSQPFVYQSLRHSFLRDGGAHPSSQELCAILASCSSPVPVTKSLRTIDLQKSIKTKGFNLFQNDRLTKNRGVGGVMVNQPPPACPPWRVFRSNIPTRCVCQRFPFWNSAA